MKPLNPDLVAEVVIPFFLRSLMRVERERVNMSQKDAGLRAGWSPTVWSAFERGEHYLDKTSWAVIKDALSLDTATVVRRLNGFINRYPSIWLELQEDGLTICERPVTSPRGLRSGKVVNFDLNPIRPVLYQELSGYAEIPAEVIAAAVSLDVYKARKTPVVSSSSRVSAPSAEVDQLAEIHEIILSLSPEKLALLDRVIDKFRRFSAKELAMAYQHFSLSLKKK